MSAFEIGLLVCLLVIGWLLVAAGGQRRKIQVLEGEVRRLKSERARFVERLNRALGMRETDSPQPPAPPS